LLSIAFLFSAPQKISVSLSDAAARGDSCPMAERREQLPAECADLNTTEIDHSKNLATSDASLLRRFRSGDDDAATELYLRYAQRLQALARANTPDLLATRFDPEDVVQSVFRTFFRRATEGFFDVPPGEELWQLLLVIALNKVRALGKYHRRQKRDIRQTVGSPFLDDARHLDDEMSLRILSMVVEEALQQLPPLQQQIVMMRIKGHEVSEIADATQRCTRTVERVLKRFRQRIAEYVDANAESNRAD
jgi:RNA polymerase sigma-70 factor (ECF subfamily)